MNLDRLFCIIMRESLIKHEHDSRIHESNEKEEEGVLRIFINKIILMNSFSNEN